MSEAARGKSVQIKGSNSNKADLGRTCRKHRCQARASEPVGKGGGASQRWSRLGPCQILFPLTCRTPCVTLLSEPRFLSSYHVQPPSHTPAVHPATPKWPSQGPIPLSSVAVTLRFLTSLPWPPPLLHYCWLRGPCLIPTLSTGSAELWFIVLAPLYLYPFRTRGFTHLPDDGGTTDCWNIGELFISLHRATTQKTAIFIFTSYFRVIYCNISPLFARQSKCGLCSSGFLTKIF
jgi:hypothetical protein